MHYVFQHSKGGNDLTKPSIYTLEISHLMPHLRLGFVSVKMFKLVVISALLIVSASATPTPPTASEDLALKTSMQTIESSYNFEETIAQLKQFLEGKNLTTFAEIDHAKGAEEAGLTLEQATVLVFGNPKAGTLLMQVRVVGDHQNFDLDQRSR